MPPARADTQTLCLAVQSPTRDPAYLNQRVEALLLSFGKSGAPSCARTAHRTRHSASAQHEHGKGHKGNMQAARHSVPTLRARLRRELWPDA